MSTKGNAVKVDVAGFTQPPDNPLKSDLVWNGKRYIKDRRKRPTPMLSRYTFVGRRRTNRRSTDPQTNYYVDRPKMGLLITALLIIVCGGVDAYFTYRILYLGGAEINPIINYCLGRGWPFCIAVKLLLTGFGLTILVLHQNFYKMHRVVYSVGVFYMLLNTYQAVLIVIAS